MVTEALTILRKARSAYVNVMRNGVLDGDSSADRRHSEGEIRSSAAEAMFDEFGALTFEQLNGLISALENPSAILADAHSKNPEAEHG